MPQLNKSKDNISSMFNDIAPKYDFLNHFLSAGTDKRWRKKVVRLLSGKKHDKILDVATGTGDLAIDLAKLKPKKIIGIDIAKAMVEIGKNKVKKKNLHNIISLSVGDSLNIDFNDNTFDVATCSFGVRNFENLEKGLAEMYRVLNNNGQIVVLEFANPDKKFFALIFKFYFNNILPLIGRMFSNNDFAYKYLPESVSSFPDRNKFTQILTDVGFSNNSFKNVCFGIACIYTGYK